MRTKVIISKNEKTAYGKEVILEHNFSTKKLAMIFVDEFQKGLNSSNLFIVKIF